MSMNQNVYETLTQARSTLFDMQTSHTMAIVGPEFRLELDGIAMAVDDALDELDRLTTQIKRLESGGE